MTENNFQRMLRENPENGFVKFVEEMANEAFRDKHGPTISLIQPGWFTELIQSAKLLGYEFTEVEVKEIISQIDIERLKREHLPEKSIQYISEWIKSCN